MALAKPLVILALVAAAAAPTWAFAPGLPLSRSGLRRATPGLRMSPGAGGRGSPELETDTEAAGPAATTDSEDALAADARQFKQGSELFELRRQVLLMERQLKYLERMNKAEDAASVRESLKETYRRDPLAVYDDFRSRMWTAARDGAYDVAASLRDAAKGVQEYLPQYNLEGLWVGKYGASGYEIIKVGYENVRGEQWLLATKVTGDEHVLAGEITFRVNLTPGRQQPPPLAVTVKGKEVELEAFGGLGVIAEKGGRSTQTVPGKLILFEENRFAFVWEPLGAHITFARVDEGIATHMRSE